MVHELDSANYYFCIYEKIKFAPFFLAHPVYYKCTPLHSAFMLAWNFMISMVSDFRHTRLYITMVDVILTSGSSDRAFRTTCPDIRHRVSKHCQRHHQGNLKFIMRFYRLESDNLRVTLAAIIERFHTRHGNLR